MDAQSENRELLPAYTFRGLVTGWRCSACDKSFHIALEQATDILAAPEQIQREFGEHRCLKVLAKSPSGL